MKIEGLDNLLKMQQRIKAVTGNNALANLVARSEAMTGQHKKLQGMFPALVMKRELDYFLNSDFVKSMKAIQENSMRMQETWKKIIDNAPLVQLARQFKGYETISAQLKYAGTGRFHPAIIEELEKQTADAADLATGITEQQHITQEDLLQLRDFVTGAINDIKVSIKKTGKSPRAVINYVMAIIGFLLAIYSTYQQETTQSASYKQVEDLKKKIEQQVADTIQELTEAREVKNNCALRLKPRMNSLFIYSVAKGSIVNIIATNHKWVYITIMDRKDNLPVSGWILKKYVR